MIDSIRNVSGITHRIVSGTPSVPKTYIKPVPTNNKQPETVDLSPKRVTSTPVYNTNVSSSNPSRQVTNNIRYNSITRINKNIQYASKNVEQVQLTTGKKSVLKTLLYGINSVFEGAISLGENVRDVVEMTGTKAMGKIMMGVDT